MAEVDTSIIQGLKPVQIDDPLVIAGRRQALVQAYQQAQAQRQQIQMQQMQIQQQQQDMQDQQKLRKAYLDAGGDIDRTQVLAAQYGVGPNVMAKANAALMQQKEALAKLKAEDLKNKATVNDMMGGLVKPILDETDPQKQQQLWDRQTAIAVQRGLVKSGEIPSYPGPEGVKQFAASLKTNDQLVKEVTASAAQKRADALASGEALRQTEFDLKKPGILLDQELKQKQLETEKQPKPGVDVPFSPEVEKQKARIAQAGKAVINNTLPGMNGAAASAATGKTGAEFLSTLPSGISAQVKAIAEGRATMPSGSTRSQAAQQLRSLVFQYDPEYSDQRAQIRRAFTSGPDGKNIGALNTAAVHADQLLDAAKSMQNGAFVPGNQAYNALRTAFGSNVVSNFELTKDAVAGELANALKGNATDIEIANISKSIKSAGSGQQLQGAVQTALHLLGAKLHTYQERYQQQIPGDTTWSPIFPSARAAFSRNNVDATAGPASKNRPSLDSIFGKK